jgi:hypothetical protein
MKKRCAYKAKFWLQSMTDTITPWFFSGDWSRATLCTLGLQKIKNFIVNKNALNCPLNTTTMIANSFGELQKAAML